MKILFCGSGWLPIVEAIEARLEPALRLAGGIAIWDRARPLEEAIADAEVVLPSNARLDEAALEAATRLRLVQQPASGVDGIDLAAAARLGVPVCNAPGANHRTVAETALFLMLALARRYPEARASFARGSLGVPIGIELGGRSLGVVGKGRSGGELARLAAALGMSVRAIDSRASADERRALWSASDFVSLHCPLSPATRGLIDDEVIAMMKAGAYLINCARGPIIDRGALERGLAAGRLAGVGLDTYWEEPWEPADPLYADPRVMTLPHVAGSSEESFARIAGIVADNLGRLQRSEALQHRIV